MGFKSTDYNIVGDILTKAEAWRSEAEAAGFKFTDFSVNVDGNVLSFSYIGPDQIAVGPWYWTVN